MIENTNLKNDMAHAFSRRNMIMPPASVEQAMDAEGIEAGTVVTIDGVKYEGESLDLAENEIIPYYNFKTSVSSFVKNNKVYTFSSSYNAVKDHIYIYDLNKSVLTEPEDIEVTHIKNSPTLNQIFSIGEDVYIFCDGSFYKVNLTTGELTEDTSMTAPYESPVTYGGNKTRFFEIKDGVVGCNFASETEGKITIAVSKDGCKTWNNFTADKGDHDGISDKSITYTMYEDGCVLPIGRPSGAVSGSYRYFGFYAVGYNDSLENIEILKNTSSGVYESGSQNPPEYESNIYVINDKFYELLCVPNASSDYNKIVEAPLAAGNADINSFTSESTISVLNRTNTSLLIDGNIYGTANGIVGYVDPTASTRQGKVYKVDAYTEV